MLRNEPRDLVARLHDIEQRLLTLDLENKRQWYDLPRAEPPVPPLWLGGPWKPVPDECPCPDCVNVAVDSPFAAGSVWNLQRSSCGEFIGTDDCGNTVSFQRYSSGGAARVTWSVVNSGTCFPAGYQAVYVGDEGSYDAFCDGAESLVLDFSNAGDLNLEDYPLPSTITVTPAECSTSSGSGSGTGSGSTGSGSGSTGSGSTGSGSTGSGSGTGSPTGTGSGSTGSGSGSPTGTGSGSGSGSPTGTGSGSPTGTGSGSSGSGSGSGSGSTGSGSTGSGSGTGGTGSGSGTGSPTGTGSGTGSPTGTGSGSGGTGSGTGSPTGTGSGSGGTGSGGTGSGSGSGTGLPCCSDHWSQNWTIEAGDDGPPVQGDDATPGTASGTGEVEPNVWCGCGFFGEIGRVYGVSQAPETPLGTLIDTSHLSSGAFNESWLLCSYSMAGGGFLFGQICYLTYEGFDPPCHIVNWRSMTTHMVVWRSWNIALAQYQYHTLFEFRLHGGPWSPGCGGGPYKLILAQYYKPGCPTDGDVVDLIYQGTLASADICYFPDTAVLHNF